MVKIANRYESASAKRRRKQKEKAIQMYNTLVEQDISKGELWSRIETAVGLHRDTIKRDLKSEGII